MKSVVGIKAMLSVYNKFILTGLQLNDSVFHRVVMGRISASHRPVSELKGELNKHSAWDSVSDLKDMRLALDSKDFRFPIGEVEVEDPSKSLGPSPAPAVDTRIPNAAEKLAAQLKQMDIKDTDADVSLESEVTGDKTSDQVAVTLPPVAPGNGLSSVFEIVDGIISGKFAKDLKSNKQSASIARDSQSIPLKTFMKDASVRNNLSLLTTKLLLLFNDLAQFSGCISVTGGVVSANLLQSLCPQICVSQEDETSLVNRALFEFAERRAGLVKRLSGEDGALKLLKECYVFFLSILSDRSKHAIFVELSKSQLDAIRAVVATSIMCVKLENMATVDGINPANLKTRQKKRLFRNQNIAICQLFQLIPSLIELCIAQGHHPFIDDIIYTGLDNDHVEGIYMRVLHAFQIHALQLHSQQPISRYSNQELSVIQHALRELLIDKSPIEMAVMYLCADNNSTGTPPLCKQCNQPLVTFLLVYGLCELADLHYTRLKDPGTHSQQMTVLHANVIRRYLTQLNPDKSFAVMFDALFSEEH
jgi:hypothetical protein